MSLPFLTYLVPYFSFWCNRNYTYFLFGHVFLNFITNNYEFRIHDGYDQLLCRQPQAAPMPQVQADGDEIQPTIPDFYTIAPTDLESAKSASNIAAALKKRVPQSYLAMIISATSTIWMVEDHKRNKVSTQPEKKSSASTPYRCTQKCGNRIYSYRLWSTLLMRRWDDNPRNIVCLVTSRIHHHQQKTTTSNCTTKSWTSTKSRPRQSSLFINGPLKGQHIIQKESKLLLHN